MRVGRRVSGHDSASRRAIRARRARVFTVPSGMPSSSDGLPRGQPVEDHRAQHLAEFRRQVVQGPLQVGVHPAGQRLVLGGRGHGLEGLHRRDPLPSGPAAERVDQPVRGDRPQPADRAAGGGATAPGCRPTARPPGTSPAAPRRPRPRRRSADAAARSATGRYAGTARRTRAGRPGRRGEEVHPRRARPDFVSHQARRRVPRPRFWFFCDRVTHGAGRVGRGDSPHTGNVVRRGGVAEREDHPRMIASPGHPRHDPCLVTSNAAHRRAPTPCRRVPAVPVTPRAAARDDAPAERSR